MQVDVAAEAVHHAEAVTAGLAAAQPEDAAENPVTPRKALVQLGVPDLAGPAPTSQHGADRQSGTDPRTHLVQAARRAIGAIGFTHAIERGGHGHAQHQPPLGKAVEPLVGNGDMQEIEGLHGPQA
ncbi:hypothetical protein D3C72_2141310 [compost metagenome]